MLYTDRQQRTRHSHTTSSCFAVHRQTTAYTTFTYYKQLLCCTQTDNSVHDIHILQAVALLYTDRQQRTRHSHTTSSCFAVQLYTDRQHRTRHSHTTSSCFAAHRQTTAYTTFIYYKQLLCCTQTDNSIHDIHILQAVALLHTDRQQRTRHSHTTSSCFAAHRQTFIYYKQLTTTYTTFIYYKQLLCCTQTDNNVHNIHILQAVALLHTDRQQRTRHSYTTSSCFAVHRQTTEQRTRHSHTTSSCFAAHRQTTTYTTFIYYKQLLCCTYVVHTRYTYTYIHTHTHARTHARTHAHTHTYICVNLRRSHDCRLIWMSVGMCVGGFTVSYVLHLLILGSCYTAHKRIVNIMKVYIKRNNIQVELIRFHKNSDFVDV